MLPTYRHAPAAALAAVVLGLLAAVSGLGLVAHPAAAAAGIAPAAAVRPQPVRPRTLHARSVPAAPGCDGRPGWQSVRGARAIAELGYPISRLAYTVHFHAAHAGYTGLTDAGAHRIELFIKPCDQQTDAALLFTLAHEVGHAIDATDLTGSRHHDWLAARGRSDAVWYGCSGCPDFATGAGDFAETFAYWRTGNRAEFRSTLAPVPTARQLRRLVPMFAVHT